MSNQLAKIPGRSLERSFFCGKASFVCKVFASSFMVKRIAYSNCARSLSAADTLRKPCSFGCAEPTLHANDLQVKRSSTSCFSFFLLFFLHWLRIGHASRSVSACFASFCCNSKWVESLKAPKLRFSQLPQKGMVTSNCSTTFYW